MINDILNRTSERSYKNKKIKKTDTKNIINIINNSPTSINGHHFSAIIIDDKNIKEKLSNIGKLQKHVNDCSLFIVFNIDLSSVKNAFKNSNEKLNNKIKRELILSGAIDATISCTMVQDYCIYKKLGTCFIGAIRHDIKKVQKILNLPKDVYPIIGLTVGYSEENKNTIKPKLNKVFMNDNYSSNEFDDRQNNYEKIMDEFYRKKYPEMKSRAFYEQIRRFYSSDSIFKGWIDLETINKIFN